MKLSEQIAIYEEELKTYVNVRHARMESGIDVSHLTARINFLETIISELKEVTEI